MAKVPRTQNELANDFANQIAMLTSRCDAYYEEGALFEYLSIATIIRVLVHDTQSSTSLLTHLNRKFTVQFLDSRSTNNLCLPGIFNGYSGFQPRTRLPYSAYRERDMYPFDDWWTQQPFKVRGEEFTRKALITAIANQEGGAHVDCETDERLAKIRRTDSNWRAIDGDETYPMRGEEMASVCAIGEEVLFSLTPEPGNRERMLVESFQQPFYWTQHQSDEAKDVLKNDLLRLEELKDGKDAAHAAMIDAGLKMIQNVVAIDTLTSEDYEVRKGVAQQLLKIEKFPWDD